MDKYVCDISCIAGIYRLYYQSHTQTEEMTDE